jgi:hypothetical protein
MNNLFFRCLVGDTITGNTSLLLVLDRVFLDGESGDEHEERPPVGVESVDGHDEPVVVITNMSDSEIKSHCDDLDQIHTR